MYLYSKKLVKKTKINIKIVRYYKKCNHSNKIIMNKSK